MMYWHGLVECDIISLVTHTDTGRFLLSIADESQQPNSCWAERPVSLDLRPAVCVTPSANDMGRFAMHKLAGRRLSPRTEFKKGSVPRNKKPVGTITIRKDKNGTNRRWIKVREPNVWEMYSVYLYKQSGGEIPHGHIVHHVDGDSLNDTLDNYRVVSRSEHARIHFLDLLEAKPPITHVKDKECPDCGLCYRGRGRAVAKCSRCMALSARKAKQNYKRRKRDERKRLV